MTKTKTTRRSGTARATSRPRSARPRRPGRPSRIHETIREARCPTCGDWIRTAVFRIHYEAAHPLDERPTGGELREIRLPERIAEYVAAGCSLEAAAAACGVGGRTAFAWQSVGEEWEDADPAEIPEDRRAFAAFTAAVKEARLAAESRHLRVIERASTADWRAAAWILERTRPERYGRVDRLRVGGDADAGPVRVIHLEKDPDFIGEVMKIYREQGVIPDDDAEPGE